MLNFKREHLFIIIIVLIIIVAGSGILIWQTIKQHQFQTRGLEDSNNYLNQDNQQEPEHREHEKQNQDNKKIYVHITGAVKNCGVYRLDEGARVVDVLKAAGGGSKKAALAKINLASRVYDGDQVYIPDKDDKLPEGKDNISSNNSSVNVGSNKQGNIDINNATRSELEKLSGIGPSKAKRILNYRNKIGRFEYLEQLLAVKGIGEKTLDKIKKELTLR